MANKDGEHPEFDDLPSPEEELSDSTEGSSDALNFSELDLGGSELGSSELSNVSGLFDFSEGDSTEASSLDLAEAGDDDVASEDEAVSEEPLDLEATGDDVSSLEDSSLSSLDDSSLGDMNLDESAPDEPVESDLDAVAAEAEPEEVSAKAKKSKKIKEKKPKKIKEEKPRSPSEKSGLLVQAQQASLFSVMLVFSAASLLIAIFFLLLELGNYGFSIGAN